MSYTAVPTKITGDIFSLAMWNTSIAGNINSGVMRMLADSGELGVAAASIDFTSIPATFAHLLLVCGLLSDQATVQAVNLALNADVTAADYSRGFVSHSGAAPNSGSANDRASGLNAHPTANAAMGPGLLLLPGYLGAAKKGWVSLAAYRDAATSSIVQMTGGHWIAAGATAAVTRITLTPATGNFNIGSRAVLYGIPQ